MSESAMTVAPEPTARLGGRELHRIVYTEEQIRERVAGMGREITRAHDGEDDLLVLGLLKGSFIFLADLVRQIERLPDPPENDLGLPDGLFLFTDIVVAIDNLKGRAMAITAVPVDDLTTDEQLRLAYDEAVERTEKIVRRLDENPPPGALALTGEPEQDPPFESSMSREQYEAGVETIRDYIRAGDAFQVVLSQRLGFSLEASPFDLYRALRSLNPSPYLYFLEVDGVTLDHLDVLSEHTSSVLELIEVIVPA